jgi:hypothetical protein
MQERKKIVQSATVRRGQTFATNSTDAMRPAIATTLSATSPAPSQSTVGAYHAL